jgi:Rieske Fe-S protein
MQRYLRIPGIISIILILAVFLSGCSDTPDTAASETIAPATTAGPLYTAGDIVRSASGSESPAWMVLGYDPATDSYTRALIYKNADGSYGYRTSGTTDSAMRVTMEKVMTVKISHVDAGAIPTAAPTTLTTEPTATATQAAATTTTSAATTETTSTTRPSIKGMDPDEGEAGTRVVTEITGSGFLKDLTAELRHKGEDNIKAKTVSWYSDKSVTATFVISNETTVGPWDIVVTNPNGLSAEYTNYFTIRGNESGPL